ncbi:hypothetical protein, partial [Nostocoides australiense]|nr:hypothetical protein [Tetrasphaera australiensis]
MLVTGAAVQITVEDHVVADIEMADLAVGDRLPVRVQQGEPGAERGRAGGVGVAPEVFGRRDGRPGH